MKKVLVVFFIMLSSVSYSQCADEPASAQDDSLSYLLSLFCNMDLVVGPEVYNPQSDTTLEYVIFRQDTVFSLIEDRGTVHAAIDRKESKKKVYCIGTVGNYRIDDFVVGIIMVRGFSDGREEEIFLPLHFNQVPISYEMDYEYATYGINVELQWAYGDGVLD